MTYQSPTDQWLHDVFNRVDADHSGVINASELQDALSNGTWKPFNPETVRLLIGLYDRDNSGTINFEEFQQLWHSVTQWLNTFKSFDSDGSGNIDKNELQQALNKLGYQLSDQFYEVAVRKFDRSEKGSILFDDFLQLCVTLQQLTSAFRYYDTDQDGWIHVSYDQFLIAVINNYH